MTGYAAGNRVRYDHTAGARTHPARTDTSRVGTSCSSGATSRAYDPAVQRFVSYLVSTMPPGNVRVSTRFKLTQLSSAMKNGVPPPTRTG